MLRKDVRRCLAQGDPKLKHLVTLGRTHLIGRYHNAKRSRKVAKILDRAGMTSWSGVPRTLHPQRVSAQRTESLERHVEAAGTIWRAQRSQRRVGRVNQARSGMETGVWRLLESGRVGMGWHGMA